MRSYKCYCLFYVKGPLGGSISVLNLMEVVTEKIDASSVGVGTFGYFNTLCRGSFPSPLVGGNVGSKELNKWIDERVANCESSDMGYRKHDALSLLLSLLKLGCQHYGKFRSPFGSDNASRVYYFFIFLTCFSFFVHWFCYVIMLLMLSCQMIFTWLSSSATDLSQPISRRRHMIFSLLYRALLEFHQ